jgi:hypothetical protein
LSIVYELDTVWMCFAVPAKSLFGSTSLECSWPTRISSAPYCSSTLPYSSYTDGEPNGTFIG